MQYLGITNVELSKALGYDPYLISRCVSGQRSQKAASAQIDAIAEYISTRAKRMQDVDWLKALFLEDGLTKDTIVCRR